LVVVSLLLFKAHPDNKKTVKKIAGIRNAVFFIRLGAGTPYTRHSFCEII